MKLGRRIRSRLRNYGLWVSVASLLLLVLQNFGVNMVAANYNALVNALLAVLAGLGVINDPTTESRWYLDDKA